MAFQEVTKAPTKAEINNLKRQYRKLEKEWDSKKYIFQQAIGAEDFEVLSVNDFLELKELYIQKKKLYLSMWLMKKK